MKERHKLLKIFLIPYFLLERKYVEYYIKKFFKNNQIIVDFNIENIYPYWLRQYDINGLNGYYDSFEYPVVTIYYNAKLKESLNQHIMICNAILKDRLRWTHFYFDYIYIEKN